MSRPVDPLAAAAAAGSSGRSRSTAAVAPGTAEAPGRGPVSERVADALLAHPAVAALSAGRFGTVATYLPGRRQPGVALGDGTEPTRVSVVLRYGAPVGPIADELRGIVAAETGARRVDVVVTDLELPGAEQDPAGR